MSPPFGDGQRVLFKSGAGGSHPHRAFGNAAQLHNAFGDHVHVVLDFPGDLIEEFVQADEVRPFHVPMRLL